MKYYVEMKRNDGQVKIEPCDSRQEAAALAASIVMMVSQLDPTACIIKQDIDDSKDTMSVTMQAGNVVTQLNVYPQPPLH